MTGDDGDKPLLPVTIGTITAGSCRIEYAVSCYMALTAWREAAHWLPQSCGPYLDMGRNDTVRRFYAECGDDEFLLFVDTDIQFVEGDITKLVDAARSYHAQAGVWPVIGGLYQSPFKGGTKLVAYKLKADVPEGEPTEGAPRRFFPLMLSDIDGIDGSSLLDIDGLGTGFMLIHRDILDHFATEFSAPQEWFYEGVANAEQGEWLGEDLFFCLRAKSLGHPVFAHSGVRLTHYKEAGFTLAPPTIKETS